METEKKEVPKHFEIATALLEFQIEKAELDYVALVDRVGQCQLS